MQASDHYFITQISIFLLLNNLTDSFSSALGNPFFRTSLWLHTSEKMVGMFNWRKYILGEISLLHYIFHSWLRHSWNINIVHFTREIKDIFNKNIWISSMYCSHQERWFGNLIVVFFSTQNILYGNQNEHYCDTVVFGKQNVYFLRWQKLHLTIRISVLHSNTLRLNQNTLRLTIRIRFSWQSESECVKMRCVWRSECTCVWRLECVFGNQNVYFWDQKHCN